MSDTNGSVSQTVMDMNGDGILDLVKTGSGGWTVYYGTSGSLGFSTTPATWSTGWSSMNLIRGTTLNPNTQTTSRDTFDINGDGIPDFVDATTNPWTVYFGICRFRKF